MTNFNYNEQAENFLQKTQTTFKAEFLENRKYFDDDTHARDVYLITLTRGNRQFSFNFGQSLEKSKDWLIRTHKETKRTKKYPLEQFLDSYDRQKNKNNDDYLLADLRIKQYNLYNDHFIFIDTIKRKSAPTAYDVLASLQKYDVGTFENFCIYFGYNNDSIKAEKIYKRVVKEFNEVQKIWNDQEILELQEIQ